jgi:hypothetical protein
MADLPTLEQLTKAREYIGLALKVRQQEVERARHGRRLATFVGDDAMAIAQVQWAIQNELMCEQLTVVVQVLEQAIAGKL